MPLIWENHLDGIQWVSANLFIAVSYLMIGLIEIKQRPQVWLLWLFILVCGIGHAMMVVLMAFAPERIVFISVKWWDTLTAIVSLGYAATIIIPFAKKLLDTRRTKKRYGY